MIIMGQSERSDIVTNRLRGVAYNGACDDSNVLRREDLNSGESSSAGGQRHKEKPLQMNQYLEVIRDESEEMVPHDHDHDHVVHMLAERSNSFFIDGSVA